MRAALAEAGAGRIGDYDHASFSTPGQGRFRPLEGANPTIGAVGEIETVAEVRIEVVLPRRAARRPSSRAMLAAHPYEEPAYDVVELADPGPADDRHRPDRLRSRRRRCGEFAAAVAAALPETAHGVRVAGDPDRAVRRVAVCGGAGDFLLDTVARTDADVYVTSDLRHHPAERVPASRTGRRWSTSRTGRPSGPGCRWWRRGCARRWAIRWRPG